MINETDKSKDMLGVSASWAPKRISSPIASRLTAQKEQMLQDMCEQEKLGFCYRQRGFIRTCGMASHFCFVLPFDTGEQSILCDVLNLTLSKAPTSRIFEEIAGQLVAYES